MVAVMRWGMVVALGMLGVRWCRCSRVAVAIAVLAFRGYGANGGDSCDFGKGREIADGGWWRMGIASGGEWFGIQ